MFGLPTHVTVTNGSRVDKLLFLGLAISLAAVLFIGIGHPDYAFYMPITILGGAAIVTLLKDELSALAVVLAAFAIVARYKEGIQIEEVLFGLLYFGYLTWWFGTRLFVYRERLLNNFADYAVAFLLVLSFLTIPLALLHGAIMSELISELISLSFFALYFPLKDASLRYPQAWKVLLTVLFFVAVFILVRNIIWYVHRLSSAQHLWQLMTGRVVINEHVLLTGGLGAVVATLFQRNRLREGAGLLLCGLFGVGIVIGQSRALWVSFLLALIVAMFLLSGNQRIKLILYVGGGLTVLFGVAFILVPDYFLLVVAGLTDRFLTLSSATQDDISLINRFVENRAVWSLILSSPVLGYGYGVPYSYFALDHQSTYVTTFVHNTYLGVWYKQGVFSLIAFLSLMFVTGGRAVLLLWKKALRSDHKRAVAMWVAICTPALLLLANTENITATSDKVLIVTCLSAFSSALWESRHNKVSI